MAKEYLKMADVFIDPSNVFVMGLCDEQIKPERNYGAIPFEYAAHAINSHDELVAEVERLRESNKRMADAIWEQSQHQGSQDKDIEVTQERFIEQYCCFPAPHQK